MAEKHPDFRGDKGVLQFLPLEPEIQRLKNGTDCPRSDIELDDLHAVGQKCGNRVPFAQTVSPEGSRKPCNPLRQL